MQCLQGMPVLALAYFFSAKAKTAVLASPPPAVFKETTCFITEEYRLVDHFSFVTFFSLYQFFKKSAQLLGNCIPIQMDTIHIIFHNTSSVKIAAISICPFYIQK